jgi:hypothetical protein
MFYCSSADSVKLIVAIETMFKDKTKPALTEEKDGKKFLLQKTAHNIPLHTLTLDT